MADPGGGGRSGAGEMEVPAGLATCAAWIKRVEKKVNRVFAVMGRPHSGSSPPLLEIFAFDANTASLSTDPLFRVLIGEEGADPLGFAVNPTGDELVCSTRVGCKLYELSTQGLGLKLVARDSQVLQSAGPQKCLAFSTDGLKIAVGGKNGHLRVYHWPSMNIILEEPKAHRSFLDMDISLDSEFLVSTSTDGSARIWNINKAVPVNSLTRNADERIQCCRFSRDGMKPFLFCTVQKGDKVITAVWDISDWKRIGFKTLMQKPVSVLSISLDGKYIALGGQEGDMCVVDVKTMEISHRSRKLHLAAAITSIEFCPTERVVISTSNKLGATVTKLRVPADWKEWQIYLLFMGIIVASLIVFYFIYEHSDPFWNSPLGRNQPANPWKVFHQKDLVDFTVDGEFTVDDEL